MRPPSFRSPAPLAAVLLLGLGCSAGPARAPNPTRPIDQTRATEVIARTGRRANLEPADGRDVRVDTGAVLHMDVGVAGHKYGVVYLTERERAAQDASMLPKKDPKHPKDLVTAVGTGRNDGGMQLLVLFDGDYVFDDQVGEEHESTSITAENELERDVRDFLAHAKREKWE